MGGLLAILSERVPAQITGKRKLGIVKRAIEAER